MIDNQNFYNRPIWDEYREDVCSLSNGSIRVWGYSGKKMKELTSAGGLVFRPVRFVKPDRSDIFYSIIVIIRKIFFPLLIQERDILKISKYKFRKYWVSSVLKRNFQQKMKLLTNVK